MPAILTSHGAIIFGSNQHGQLGLGHNLNISSPILSTFKGKIDEFITGDHIGIILSEGDAYIFGDNELSNYGMGHERKVLIAPTLLPLSHKIISVACGTMHTVMNTDNGVWGFGVNYKGQLGEISKEEFTSPIKLKFPHVVTDIACGYDTTIINSNGKLYVTGGNDMGNLGLGHNNDVDHFTRLKFEGYIDEVSCGPTHTAIMSNGRAYLFGSNYCSELGINCWGKFSTPIALQFDGIISKIALGYCRTLVLDVEGNLFVCGDNSDGELGLGHTESVDILEQFKFDFPIDDIFIDNNITTMISQGRIYVCGYNQNNNPEFGLSKLVLVPTLLRMDNIKTNGEVIGICRNKRFNKTKRAL